MAFAAALAVPCAASAQEVGGAYGRLDGDLVLSAEASGGVWSSAAITSGAMGVAARVRYLDMIGLAVGYDRAFASARHDAMWAAVDLRPAWFARFFSDLEHGPRWLDLMIDSIAIELGGAWMRPGEPIGAGGGFGLCLGSGVELPLVWSRGDAVLFRASVRWLSSHPWDAQGTGASDSVVEAGAGLVFRTLLNTGLAERVRRER